MSVNTYLPGTLVIPGFLVITAITNSYPMVVTFTNTPENTYVVGQLVRLFIPQPYKMFQANGLTGQILAINGSTFSLDINSSQFDVFVTPPPFTSQPATLAPAGSRNLIFSNADAQVPFQSLNNIGN